MTNSVQYIYQVIDRFSGPLNTFENKVKRATRGVTSMGERLQRTGEKMQNLAGAVGGAAVGAALTQFVKKSVAVEDALADLVRVGDLTTQQVQKMDSAMESLSEELGKDKVGLLEQAFSGLKLGIPVDELDEFVRLGARTAVAFDIMDAEAGRSLGSIRAKLGLNQDQLGNMMDQVNFLADNFAADGSRMIEIIERTSGTMSTLNFPTEVIAGLAGFADQIEVTEELAASGLNQMFMQFKKSPKIIKEMMTDPMGALTKQLNKFANIDASKRGAVLQKVFGMEAARFIEKAIARMDVLKETMDASASDNALGSMMREMENRAGRSSTVFLILKNVAMNVFEDIGNVIKPIAVTFARFSIEAGKSIKAFVNGNPGMVKFAATIAGLVAAVPVLAVVLGALAMSASVLLSPFGLIASAVIALGAAFVYWWDTGHPVIDMMKSIGSEMGDVASKIMELVGLVDSGSESFLSWEVVMSKVGKAIEIMLVPLKVLVQTLSTAVDMVSSLSDGNFSAAFNAVSGGISNAGSTIAEGFSDVKSLFGFGSDDATKSVADQKAGRSKLDINSQTDVRVQAEPGTRVTSTNTTLNTGGQGL